MASADMSLSIVRRSLLGLRRDVLRRASAAAPQRVPIRCATAPISLSYNASRHKTTGTSAFRRRASKIPEEPRKDAEQEQEGPNSKLAHTLQASDTSDLVTEVNIKHDPYGVLPEDHPAMSVLGNSGLVIQRQIEMMNLLMGFEQANRYIIMNGEGETVGYIAEMDHGIGRSIMRNMAKTHRSFTTYVFDKSQREVLRIHRPFAYLNTKIRIYDPLPNYRKDNNTTDVAAGHGDFVAEGRVSPLKLEEMKIIGECQSHWTATRRKYNLFSYRTQSNETTTEATVPDAAIEAHMKQFAYIDEPMLSWDFTVRQEDGRVMGNVNRSFRGFAREIFTDTGVYALRLDAAAQSSALEDANGKEIARYEDPGLTLDQRAVMIATAVSIDFDYFSRHSHSGPGFMPMFIPMGGGGAAAEGGAVAGAGAVGAAEGMTGAAAGAAGRGIAGAGGAVETGAVGAGTMAGYEAMQRGAYGSNVDDASPQAPDAEAYPGQFADQAQNQAPVDNEVWGAEQDPWSESAGNVTGGGGGGDGGSGGGWLDFITDFFKD